MADHDFGISPFHAALNNISMNLTEHEVKVCLFVCKKQLSKSQREQVKSAIDLFDILEERGKISESDYQLVIALLGQIKREDLKKAFLQEINAGGAHNLSPEVPTGARPPLQTSGNITPQGGLKTPNDFAHTSPPTISQAPFKPGFSSGTPNKPGPVNSHEMKDSSSRHQGRNFPSMMANLSLDSPVQLKSASTTPELLDDVETDSPVNAASSLCLGKGRARAFLGMNPETDSPISGHQRRDLIGRPPGVPSSHQGQGSVARPLMSDLPYGAQQVREERHPGGMTPSRQGQGLYPLAGPLVDLSSNSPDIWQQMTDESHPHDMATDGRFRSLERMMEQQEAREEARAAGSKRPKLRKYQEELAEKPLQRFENYIICAPTGSGKTLTAACICYHYWTWFKSSISHKHFKALFIVNMRHLTQQQRDAFQKYFPVKEAVRTIGDQQTFEDALKIDKPLPAVLMLTAQIFVNALVSNKVDITDIDMLIFDECHHTDLKHPYNEIMKTYLKKKRGLPRPPPVGVSGVALPFVIGLSASLGVGSDAHSHLLTLCGNMDAKGVIRVRRYAEELQRYVNIPEKDSIKSVWPRAESDRQFGDLLEGIMSEIEDQLPEIEERPLPARGSQLYESEVVKRRTDAQKTGYRTAVIIYMYLYEYNRALVLYDDLRVVDGLRHLEKFHMDRGVSANEELVPAEEHCRRLFNMAHQEMQRMSQGEAKHSSEKLGQLAFLLNEIFTENLRSKGIVLVRMKVATRALCEFIRDSKLLEALPCRMRPQRFVGQGDIEDDCMTEAKQRDVLQSFRNENGCNILVATDIAQEGLDMPACNFVIRYNFVSNEIGTVQSKGRARAKGSQCYLIVESGSSNEKREFDNRSKVEKMKEAMEELEAIGEQDRLDKITERQMEILEKIRRQEEEVQQRQAMDNLDKISVHCKECSAFVCKASELRRKGDAGHVTCISPEFKRWVKEIKYGRPQRYRDTETVGLVSCGTEDCGQRFGTIQKFLQLDPPDGYALKAQSFKIHLERGGVKTPKQWNKAGFEIITDEK